ncbi:MAG: hydantoinase B/oxoprolinase family protein, partial [Pseudomonadota bacterium]
MGGQRLPAELGAHAPDVALADPRRPQHREVVPAPLLGHADAHHAHVDDVYEEGALIFPAVRVQRDYEDNVDIINMCMMRIRVPEQ